MYHYFSGIDNAHGGADTYNLAPTHSGDDAVIATIRAHETGPAEFVDCQRFNGIQDSHFSALCHKKHAAFKYTYMVVDPSGGGLFVLTHMREAEQHDGREEFRVRPLITVDDEQLAGIGEPIVIRLSRGESRIRGRDNDRRIPGIGVPLSSESVIPNLMHEKFRAALEQSPPEILLPPLYPGFVDAPFSEPDDMRRFLNETDGMSATARAHAEMSLAISQLIPIEPEKGPDEMTPKLDKTGLYTFCSGQKKDAAYALIMAYFGLWLWRQELRIFAQRKKPREAPAVTVDRL